MGPRLLKKKKAKDVSIHILAFQFLIRMCLFCVCVCMFCQIARHILEAHASMLNLGVLDAKLQYIRNWQALQDFGITYFLVKVGRSRKEVRGVVRLVDKF